MGKTSVYDVLDGTHNLLIALSATRPKPKAMSDGPGTRLLRERDRHQDVLGWLPFPVATRHIANPAQASGLTRDNVRSSKFGRMHKASSVTALCPTSTVSTGGARFGQRRRVVPR
jgi:hypothetical protein